VKVKCCNSSYSLVFFSSIVVVVRGRSSFCWVLYIIKAKIHRDLRLCGVILILVLVVVVGCQLGCSC